MFTEAFFVCPAGRVFGLQGYEIMALAPVHEVRDV
jgi:hypothetical protein